MSTFRTSAAGGNNTLNTAATATLTPAVNDLWVAFGVSVNAGAGHTLTDNNGGTWSLVRSSTFGGGFHTAWVRNQLFANTTSTIVTLTAAAPNTGIELVVVAISGAFISGPDAILQSQQNTGVAGVATVTLGVAVNADNMVLIGLADLTNPPALTVPTGFSLTNNVGQATPIGLEVAIRNSGFTGTAITWVSNPGTNWGSIAMEISPGIASEFQTLPGFTSGSTGGPPLGSSSAFEQFCPPVGVPAVTNISPTPLLPVLPDTPIQFDITVVGGFAQIIPMISLNPFTVPEPVHNGTDFEPLYLDGGSTRVAITNGFRYTIRRKHGWLAQPNLIVYAVSNSGGVFIGP